MGRRSHPSRAPSRACPSPVKTPRSAPGQSFPARQRAETVERLPARLFLCVFFRLLPGTSPSFQDDPPAGRGRAGVDARADGERRRHLKTRGALDATLAVAAARASSWGAPAAQEAEKKKRKKKEAKPSTRGLRVRDGSMTYNTIYTRIIHNAIGLCHFLPSFKSRKQGNPPYIK